MADLVFEKIPTGRTHQVNGVYEPILGSDGELETEWALAAIIDGHRVVLQTFSLGYVEHMVGRPDTEVSSEQSSSSSSSSETGATAETGTTAGECEPAKTANG